MTNRLLTILSDGVPERTQRLLEIIDQWATEQDLRTIPEVSQTLGILSQTLYLWRCGRRQVPALEMWGLIWEAIPERRLELAALALSGWRKPRMEEREQC